MTKAQTNVSEYITRPLADERLLLSDALTQIAIVRWAVSRRLVQPHMEPEADTHLVVRKFRSRRVGLIRQLGLVPRVGEISFYTPDPKTTNSAVDDNQPDFMVTWQRGAQYDCGREETIMLDAKQSLPTLDGQPIGPNLPSFEVHGLRVAMNAVYDFAYQHLEG